MGGTILVPLDFGPEADRALPVARALADATGGRVELVVVTSETQAEADEKEAAWHARSAGVAVDGIHLRYDDDVASAILAQAQASDATLCLASHAYHPVVAALCSSVGSDVVRLDTQPLVLVGPECDARAPVGGRLLACLGGRGDAAVPDVAARWARSLGAKVEVLTVDHDMPEGGEAAASAAAQLLEEEGIDTTWNVVTGQGPSDAILAAADQMGGGLVVLGVDRAGREHRLGRVARTVIRHSHRPVLLAPTPLT